MQTAIRFAAVALSLALVTGCGAQENSQPAPASNAAPAAETPAGAKPEASPSTPSADMRSNAAPVGGSASSSALGTTPPAASAAPAAPAKPIMMPMDVPSGTDLVLTLDTPLSSETAKVEQVVRATVAKAVVISGMTVIPEGAAVSGNVVAVQRSARVKGRALLALRFNEVTVAGTEYRINTARITRQAEATKGEDATKIGIGAGVGTAIGAIAGGKKGAAIGAGVGAGAGTGAVLATRGKEVVIPAGATLSTTVQETVRITAPMS